MAAPAHTGMLSVTAINACECFALCLHLIVLYELILTCPISCMYWRYTLHNIFVSRVAEWKRPPADNGWQSVGGYWKPLPQDLFLAKSKVNHTNHTKRLKSAQKSDWIYKKSWQRENNWLYVLYGVDSMHFGRTVGPRGDHFKENQLWGFLHRMKYLPM